MLVGVHRNLQVPDVSGEDLTIRARENAALRLEEQLGNEQYLYEVSRFAGSVVLPKNPQARNLILGVQQPSLDRGPYFAV